MIPVVISGLGHCSALGQGLDCLRQAWRKDHRPPVTPEKVRTAQGEMIVSALRAPSLAVPKLVPEAVERRMSKFAKMCFGTMAEALTDAGVMHTENSERCGVVIGTAFGNLDLANNYQRRILEDGPAGASPTLFAASIHNSLAAQLTLAFGLRGPNSTVSTMEQTAIGSVRLAYDWIQQGVVDRAVVLIGDELSQYHLYYFAHQPSSCIAGEGMIALVLERADRAQKKYARLNAPSLTSAPTAGKIFKGNHQSLYGSMLTGTAFELALAALEVERTSEPVVCVQECQELPPQSVVFSYEA